ncbi:hypothetical protein JXJ21_08180 [candidate division KSB1 bacterium]|nr:hypothetical protein [candidate division KSB1 bacterium]
MRIGEIAVISPPGKANTSFISSICPAQCEGDNKTCFGRLQINDQLMLHLYGISIDENIMTFAWDLVSKKMLGYILLFNWFDEKAISSISPIVDFLSSRYETVMVFAAYTDQGNFPLPEPYIDDGILIAPDNRLVFCRLDDSQSNRHIVISLINMIIEKLP